MEIAPATVQIYTFDQQDIDDIRDGIINLTALYEAGQAVTEAQMAAILLQVQLAVSLGQQNNTILQLNAADLQLLKDWVQQLTTLANGNATQLGLIWGVVQNLPLSFADMMNLLDTYYLLLKAQLDVIDANVASIQIQMVQVLANQAALAFQNDQLLDWADDHSDDFDDLVDLVGGMDVFMQIMHDAVLDNGQGIDQTIQNSSDNAALLAIAIANQGNIQDDLAAALVGINQNGANNAAQTVMLDALMNGLNALGVDVGNYANIIIDGIDNLQLGQGNQNIVLGQLLANSNNQALVSQQILDYVSDLPNISANINGIAIQLAGFEGAFNAFAAEAISRFDVLQLSIDNLGTVVATLVGFAVDQIAISNLILAKLDTLQMSVDDLHNLQLIAIDHLVDIKVDIADLQGAINGVTNLVMTLTDITVAGINNLVTLIANIETNLCCNNGCGQGGDDITINNVINTVVNVCPTLPTATQQQNCLNNGINLCDGVGNGSIDVDIDICPTLLNLSNVNNSGTLIIGNNNVTSNNSQIGNIETGNGC